MERMTEENGKRLIAAVFGRRGRAPNIARAKTVSRLAAALQMQPTWSKELMTDTEFQSVTNPREGTDETTVLKTRKNAIQNDLKDLGLLVRIVTHKEASALAGLSQEVPVGKVACILIGTAKK